MNARVVTQRFKSEGCFAQMHASKMRRLMILMITAVATILAPVAGNPFLDASSVDP